MCFLDASKAFDRVNHWHLFTKLLKRGFPKLIVRLLMIWYTCQKFSVQWGHCMSSMFTVLNGVRQGGILSPVLFNAFVDDLSIALQNVQAGCFFKEVNFNHLIYADDTVLLAPSPSGLQKLLDVCETFAKENELVYNTKKTVCMCFSSQANRVCH